MSVGRELSDIRRTMETVLEPIDAAEERRTAQDRWSVYEKTLQEVNQTAGRTSMQTLATWIKIEMREREDVPSGVEVREAGGRICRDQGYDVDDDSWLRP